MRIKSYILFVWTVLDWIYYTCSRLTYVGSGAERNIFRVKLLCYRGKELTLKDGTCIQKGDMLLKIHLHNVVLLKEVMTMMSDLKKGKHIYRLVERSLPGVASYVRNHLNYQQIKAIIGITTLDKAVRPLGFEVFCIPNVYYRIFKWVTQMPLNLLFVSQPLLTLKKHAPHYLLMSKDSLMTKYTDKDKVA